jgi:FkbM family methyltransferase
MISGIKKIFNNPKNLYGKTSYSQCGEDLIIKFFLDDMNITRPIYLDIGAYHPHFLSNTFLFYINGGSGVLIEPDPYLFKEIKKCRKRDICLNVGVGIENVKKAKYYVMTNKTLSTFSKKESECYVSNSAYGKERIEKVIDVEMLSIDNILNEFFKTTPNLVSIDAEGMDYEILKKINLNKIRPEVFCIETIRCKSKNVIERISKINKFMESNDYLEYANTFINSIFIDKKKWNKIIG